MRVRHRPSVAVFLCILRAKINCTCSGRPQIDVLANDLLEKAPAVDCSVPDLSEGELRLEDRKVIAVTRFAVLGAERVRQPGQPLTEHRLDLFVGQSIAQPLSRRPVAAGQQPIIQRLEGNVPLGQLLF